MDHQRGTRVRNVQHVGHNAVNNAYVTRESENGRIREIGMLRVISR